MIGRLPSLSSTARPQVPPCLRPSLPSSPVTSPSRSGRASCSTAVSCTIGPLHRVGVVAPNGTGKSTLLKILAGLDAPDSGTRHAARRRRATVGYLPQEPERPTGRDGARLPRPPHRGRRRRARARRRVGRARRARLRAPTTPTRTRSSATSRSARPTSTRGVGAVCADLGLAARVARPRDAGAVGRPGRAREPRRDRARPLRRVPARRADQRPRLRRPRTARAVPARRAHRRRGHRVARPRVPRPHDHVGARARRAPTLGHRVRGRLAVVPRRAARPRAATPRRTTPSTGRSAASCATGRNGSGSGRCRARPR